MFLLCCLSACGFACSRSTAESASKPSDSGITTVTSTGATTVDTKYGKVSGYVENGVYIYIGIPYAKAARFMAPEEPDRWEGIRSSRAYGPTCPQAERTGWHSDEQAYAFDWDDGYPGEDCLRLNIWTNNIGIKEKRPVMVWLHGGGYAAGSGQELPSYDGSNLARTGDVVVVTLNHRLNVLGFLDLSAFGERYANSGNAGLLDLVAALQWVKGNIANFGGDPSNVTIFGQSGGGGKVSTLLATPAAAGLFHKAIVQSGSMMRTMTPAYSRKIGVETVTQLGLNASNIDDIANIPYSRLLEAGQKAVEKVRKEAESEGITSFMFGWAPTVDGNVLPAQPFDGKAPEQSRDIPMIIGTTQHEFTASTYIPGLRQYGKEQVMDMLKDKYGARTDEFTKAFAEAYPQHKPLDMIDCDFIFRPNAVEQANIKSRQEGAPVYMYLFRWESPVLDGMLRSTHCMEIPFVFNNVDRHRSMTGADASAMRLGDTMSKAWVNFAYTGKPSAPGLPEWDAYTQEGGTTMVFDTICETYHNHDKRLLDIVRSFPIRGF